MKKLIYNWLQTIPCRNLATKWNGSWAQQHPNKDKTSDGTDNGWIRDLLQQSGTRPRCCPGLRLMTVG